MVSQTRRKTLLAGALALAILPLGVAHAGAVGPQIVSGDNVMVSVSVADLNLATEAGARTALGRLKVAAREVCSPEPGIAELARWQRYETCVRGKVDKAVAEIGSPLMASLTRHRAASSSLAEARR